MKKLNLLAMGTLLLFSCTSKPNHTNANQKAATAKEHNHDEQEETLSLNQGKKWAFNNEMKPFVLVGENSVDFFLENKKTYYQTLAAKLKVQNIELIKNCTVAGESHDELHKWIYPHIGLEAVLEKAEDNVKATETVIELQKSFQLYHQYFN